MKRVPYLTTIILCIWCLSCSNREAKEKALKDLEMYQQNAADFKASVEGGQNRLRVLNEDLVIAQDQLNQVATFQFLRTAQEKEQQLRAATDRFLEVQEQIKDTEKMILASGDSLTSAQASIARSKEVLKD
jgi:DNA repair exonuclease SbcCD ATPase subunit